MRIIMTAALLLTSAPAWSQSFSPFYGDKTAQMNISKETVSRSGNVIRVWTETRYARPLKSGTTSVKELIDVNCDQMLMRTIDTKIFVGNKFKTGRGIKAWEHLAPGSNGFAFTKKICEEFYVGAEATLQSDWRFMGSSDNAAKTNAAVAFVDANSVIWKGVVAQFLEYIITASPLEDGADNRKRLTEVNCDLGNTRRMSETAYLGTSQMGGPDTNPAGWQAIAANTLGADVADAVCNKTLANRPKSSDPYDDGKSTLEPQ